jgi:branched-chain amino acid transport system permease protein
MPTNVFAILVLLIVAAFPYMASDYYIEVVAGIMIFAMFAMSLDLLVGCTGLVSLGHAAYFGVGAYTLALMTPKYESANLLVTVPVAIAVSAVAALLVGALVLRTKGTYFIMATLAFAQMFYFIVHDTPLGGGSDGISMNFRPALMVEDHKIFALETPIQIYLLILACLVLTFVFMRLVLRSPFGHAIKGIRSNEHRMIAIGFPVFQYKLACFTLAGAVAGGAGYLYASLWGFVNPEILSWHQSVEVLVMLILGGLGSPYGAIAGAAAFIALREGFGMLTTHWHLPMGLTIVVLVLFVQGGLAKLAGKITARRMAQ